MFRDRYREPALVSYVLTGAVQFGGWGAVPVGRGSASCWPDGRDRGNLFTGRHDPREKPGERPMNNFPKFTAAGRPHLKIVVGALVCAPLGAGMGVAARVADTAGNGRLEATVIKAGTPVTASTGASTIR